VHLDVNERSGTLPIGRPPPPQDVLRVEDEHVGPAHRDELRVGRTHTKHRDTRPKDRRRFPRPKIDPVDRASRSIERVGRAVGPENGSRKLDRRLDLLEAEGDGRLDRDHVVELVESVDHLSSQRTEGRLRHTRRGGDRELLVGVAEELGGLRRLVGHEVDPDAEDLAYVRPDRFESPLGDGDRGEFAGARASGSGGGRGTSVRWRWVAATSVASSAIAPSLPVPSAATKRWWRCSIADWGWSVTSAFLSSSTPIRDMTLAETRTSES